MEGPTIVQVLLICLLVGYGVGVTAALLAGGRSQPIIVESHDRDNAASWGCTAMLLLLGLVFLVVILLTR